MIIFQILDVANLWIKPIPFYHLKLIELPDAATAQLPGLTGHCCTADLRLFTDHWLSWPNRAGVFQYIYLAFISCKYFTNYS